MKKPSCVFIVAGALTALPSVCLGQDAAAKSQVDPAALTGTGKAKYVPMWKTSSTLGDSVVYQSGSDIGIGTTAPAATLEVNGSAQVDGTLTLNGGIFESGAGLVIFAPTNGSNNFSAGANALPAATTGSNNTAVGDSALHGNTTGINNTAMGQNAMAANTTGENNVAIGGGALQSNTTSSGNTAVGGGALQNTTGTANVAIGTGALNNAGGSSNNVAIGWGAGGPGGGNYSISIGVSAASNVSGNLGNILIGTNGASSDNNTIRIGGGTSGIGDAMTQKAFFVSGVRGATTGNNNAVPVVIDSNGQLGTVSSSIRFKEDVRDMSDASDKLLQLRPVTFRYKKAFDDGSKPVQYGLIAEEVAEVYPDLVARSADGQAETVKYQLLDPMLLNELQKQHATLAAQKEQIRLQEDEIHSLAERLAQLEAAMARTGTDSAR